MCEYCNLTKKPKIQTGHICNQCAAFFYPTFYIQQWLIDFDKPLAPNTSGDIHAHKQPSNPTGD
jgi:hypothetical protein